MDGSWAGTIASATSARARLRIVSGSLAACSSWRGEIVSPFADTTGRTPRTAASASPGSIWAALLSIAHPRQGRQGGAQRLPFGRPHATATERAQRGRPGRGADRGADRCPRSQARTPNGVQRRDDHVLRGQPGERALRGAFEAALHAAVLGPDDAADGRTATRGGGVVDQGLGGLLAEAVLQRFRRSQPRGRSQVHLPYLLDGGRQLVIVLRGGVQVLVQEVARRVRAPLHELVLLGLADGADRLTGRLLEARHSLA